MEQFFNPEFFKQIVKSITVWIQENVFHLDNFIQVCLLGLIIPLSLIIGRRIRKGIDENITIEVTEQFRLKQLYEGIKELIPYIVLAFFLWATGTVLEQIENKSGLIDFAETIILVWIAIQIAASVILDKFWSKVVTVLALAVAVLDVFGLLTPTIDLLNRFGFSLGGVQLTLLSVLKAGVLIFLLLKIGIWVADQFEERLKKVDSLTPSVQVLVSKVIKIAVIGIVCIAALDSIGVSLSALAVFSGAIGVGIGLGLQKVVSNFISGIILLVDKSIKPGDVIQIGEVYGWVSDFMGRYASVVTRDGKEYLIPNEDLITQQVINWSYTDEHIRVKIPVGISYDSDVHFVMDLMKQAVKNVDRVLGNPSPVCLLKGFGDNSVDLELRFWIADPQNGMANIRSIVMLNIWDLFKENQIEIPYPQRDVHIDTTTPVKVVNVDPQAPVEE